MDWISWRWRTARTRVVTPSSTVVGLSIASLPSATSSPPAKGTACRQTPPPDATNATHVDASGSACTATREDATEPGLGCTRVPSFEKYGSSTSDRTRDVTRMESLPSPTNLWRFDPMAAMIAERRETRRPPPRVTRAPTASRRTGNVDARDARVRARKRRARPSGDGSRGQSRGATEGASWRKSAGTGLTDEKTFRRRTFAASRRRRVLKDIVECVTIRSTRARIR